MERHIGPVVATDHTEATELVELGDHPGPVGQHAQ
jgi:hypothetical protein